MSLDVSLRQGVKSGVKKLEALEHGMLKKAQSSVRASTVSFDSIGDFQKSL